MPEKIRGVSTIVKSEYGGVANAIGASIAQISGQYEQIYIYSKEPREESLKDAQNKAVKQAVLAGALEDTIELVEVEETPRVSSRKCDKIKGKSSRENGLTVKGRVLVKQVSSFY